VIARLVEGALVERRVETVVEARVEEPVAKRLLAPRKAMVVLVAFSPVESLVKG